ncbi:MAG: ATP-binding protein [Bacteroidota bacterium]
MRYWIIIAYASFSLIRAGDALAQSQFSDSLAQVFVNASPQKQQDIINALDEEANNNPKQTITSAQGILQLAKQQGQPDTLSGIYLALANAYQITGSYDLSVLNATKSIDILRQQPNTSARLANVLNLLGTTQGLQSHYVESLKSHHEALAIYEHLENRQGIARTYIDIGNLHSFQKEFHDAINYYEKSLDLSLAIQDTINIVYLYSNIALIWRKHLDSLDLAIEYYQHSLEWAERQNDENVTFVPLYGFTHVLIKLGQLDKALSNAKYILDLTQRQQNIRTRLYAWQLLAHVQWARKEQQAALRAATEAYNLAVESKALLEIGELGKLLADYYSELGDFEKAHQYRSVQVAYQDSVYSVEKSKIIANLEQTQAETKIKVLEKDNALKKARIEQQMIYTVGTSLVAILLLGALILVYISYTHRKKLIFQLAEQKEEIETNNDQLVQMNDKLQQQQQQLESKNQDLSRLNQLKDKLLSVISHDFRSPLNSLKGIINILDSGGLSPHEIPQLFGTLSTTVDNTTNMLDNLLKWTRNQMSGIRVTPEQFTLSKTITEVIGIQTTIAEKKGVTLKKKVDAAISVYADPEMIRLVIRNLVSNATKFTDKGDTITIEVQQQNQQVLVTVSDTGVGISPEDMKKLFHLNNHTTYGTANEKGTGLGLVLCREFVEGNGGNIWVESELDQGTTFFFTLITKPDDFPEGEQEQNSGETDLADNHKTTEVVH